MPTAKILSSYTLSSLIKWCWCAMMAEKCSRHFLTIMEADNAVFIFSSPRQLIEINVQCVYPKENVYIYLFISATTFTVTWKTKCWRGAFPSSLCHPSNVYILFWRWRTVNTAPPQMWPSPRWLCSCRLYVVMYIERDNIFNLFALVLKASALYWQPWINLH